MSNKTESLKLFRWYDELIVARDLDDAKALLKERYTSSEIRSEPLRAVLKSVELIVGGDDDNVSMFTPAEAVQACGRGIVPGL